MIKKHDALSEYLVQHFYQKLKTAFERLVFSNVDQTLVAAIFKPDKIYLRLVPNDIQIFFNLSQPSFNDFSESN